MTPLPHARPHAAAPALRSPHPCPRVPRRPHATAAWVLSLGLALAGCSSSPPYQLYQLRAEPPAGAPAAPPASAGAGGIWTIGPITLPEYLDREAILVPTGQAGLAALPQQRWAEPLRDAVPRILRQDLSRLRGTGQVWAHPAPPGVKAERQLRLEVQQFGPSPDGQQVQLQARWWFQDSQSGALVGQVQQQVFSAPVPAGAGADGLVAAMRGVLWEVAVKVGRGG